MRCDSSAVLYKKIQFKDRVLKTKLNYKGVRSPAYKIGLLQRQDTSTSIFLINIPKTDGEKNDLLLKLYPWNMYVLCIMRMVSLIDIILEFAASQKIANLKKNSQVYIPSTSSGSMIGTVLRWGTVPHLKPVPIMEPLEVNCL